MPAATVSRTRSWINLLLLAAVSCSAFAGCLRLRAPTTPLATRAIDVKNELASGGRGGPTPEPCLVLFLPGLRDSLGAYRRHHFARMAVRSGVSAEFLEVDVHLGYYQAETVSRRLHEDVVLPAQARGVRKIWIAGISMGGLGGFLYAKDHPGQVRGVIALAPYLGDTEPANVASAGGLAHWKPGPPREVADYERQLWAWLKSYQGGPSAAGAPIPTDLYLGYGLSDALGPADKLLADVLHPDRVFTARGSHTWSTWTELWRSFLESGTLQRDCGHSAEEEKEGKDGASP